jgi:hypothetical protein
MERFAPRQPRAGWIVSVDVRNETPGMSPIGVIFGAETPTQQSLLKRDAREHDTERQHGNDDTHP